MSQRSHRRTYSQLSGQNSLFSEMLTFEVVASRKTYPSASLSVVLSIGECSTMGMINLGEQGRLVVVPLVRNLGYI